MNIFNKRNGQNGFTLIEIIAVFVLIGILTFVAIGRSSYDAEVYGNAEVLKSHLRYAQVKAMNADVDWAWGVKFTAGSYALVDVNGSTATASLPGEISGSSSFSSTISTIMFDQRGRPASGTVVITSPVTITVSQGTSSTSITVTPNTGFIP